MYERIKKLLEYFNKENKNSSLWINSDLFKKYGIFKKWLIENGAIFTKNIDFPYAYGPFNLIGCKSVSEIQENESILLIPKKLMIISRELNYMDELIKDIKEELDIKYDIPTIYLTLYLYLENKKENSFFRPYLDLIFSNYNFLNDFTEENLKYFNNDENMINSIKCAIEDLNELYNIIKQNKNFSEINKDELFFCYSQVISRQFYIDENTSALIPLADLLNHNNINVHYELYDSQNYVFKNSSDFTTDLDNNIDIRPSFIKELPRINDYDAALLKPFNINKIKSKLNRIKIIEIKDSDYFSISTSKGESIKKGSQVFNNYFNGRNKYFLKNYGFCIINNRYDYTPIIIKIKKRKDKWQDKYFEIIFKKRYKNKNYLKIKIHFNKVSFYLIKYYRFLYFYEEKNDMNQYIDYKFDIELEINFISLTINCLESHLNLMNKSNGNIENELGELENELFNSKNNKINSFKVNAYIYRITQKINILNQIELLECLLSIMNKHKKEIKGYIDLLDYEKEFKNISQFDSDEFSKIKIVLFIRKIIDFNKKNW